MVSTGTQLNITVLYLQILRLIVVVLTYSDSNCNSVYKYRPIVTCTGALGSSRPLVTFTELKTVELTSSDRKGETQYNSTDIS